MSTDLVASNALVIDGDHDGDHITVAIFPSSVKSGAATIHQWGKYGTPRSSVLLTLDDVRALRDHLTTCLEQADA